MARRSRTRQDRDTSDIASLLAPVQAPTRAFVTFEPAVSDRRLFHPEDDFSPALGFGSVPASVTFSTGTLSTPRPPLSKRTSGLPTGSLIGHPAFAAPPGVAICVRRKQRREVLHALRKTKPGRGRSKRRNYYSEVKC